MSRIVSHLEQNILKNVLETVIDIITDRVVKAFEKGIKPYLLSRCFISKEGTEEPDQPTEVPGSLALQLAQQLASDVSKPVGSRASQPSGSANLFSPGSDDKSFLGSLGAVAFTNR
jgi:hypothetical protein